MRFPRAILRKFVSMVRRTASSPFLVRARRRGCVLAFAAVMVLGPGKPAEACSVFNPICWVEEAVDFLEDVLEEIADIVVDVLTLDLEGLFDDIGDVFENVLCGGATLFSLAGGDIAEDMFDDCSASQLIEPEALAKLAQYFRSDFSEVRIHTDCNGDFEGRGAITFGEHIYFKAGKYDPLCSSASPGPCGHCRTFVEAVAGPCRRGRCAR